MYGNVQCASVHRKQFLTKYKLAHQHDHNILISKNGIKIHIIHIRVSCTAFNFSIYKKLFYITFT